MPSSPSWPHWTSRRTWIPRGSAKKSSRRFEAGSWSRRSGPHGGEPRSVPLIPPVHRAVEHVLELLRHRPPAVGGQGPVVHLADRRHLGGRAGEEALIRRVQVEPGEVALGHLVALVPGDGDDRIAGDAV